MDHHDHHGSGNSLLLQRMRAEKGYADGMLIADDENFSIRLATKRVSKPPLQRE